MEKKPTLTGILISACCLCLTWSASAQTTATQSGNWSDAATWGGSPPTGDEEDVVIPMGIVVTLNTSDEVGEIRVMGTLAVAAGTYELTCDSLIVMGPNSEFVVGTENARYDGDFTLTLKGEPNENFTHMTHDMGARALLAMNGGTLNLHGQDRIEWTRIDADADAGATSITTAEVVDWRPGDDIILVSSTSDWTEVEELTVASVTGGGKTVNLTSALEHWHCGTSKQYTRASDGKTWTAELRAEVGLMTRNITIQGASDSTEDGFGAHIMVHGADTNMATGYAYIEGIEIHHGGQESILGRYPFHWHLVAGAGAGQYFKDSAIHDSFNRGVTIHGTDGTTVSNNFMYNTIGHTLFLEDGVEENNTITYNVVCLSVAPEPGTEVTPSDNQMLAEHQNSCPAAFWITHPNNNVSHNVAAGGEGTGFWYIFPTKRIGPSKDLAYYDNATIANRSAPGTYVGNTSHSYFNGFDIFDELGSDHSIKQNIGWYENSDHVFDSHLFYACQNLIYSGSGKQETENNSGNPTSNLIFRDCVFADGQWHLDFAASATLEESCFVADTGLGMIDVRERFLMRIYDGAPTINDSYFVGWDNTGSNATNFVYPQGTFTKRANWTISGMETDHPGTNVFMRMRDFDRGTPSFQNGDAHPRVYLNIVHDSDGSLTGTARSSLLSRMPLAMVGDEVELPNHHGMYHSTRSYAVLKPFKRVSQNGLIANYTRTKPGTPDAYWYGVNGYTGSPIAAAVIVNEDFLYTVNYHMDLPTSKPTRWQMRDARPGDVLLWRLPNAGNVTGLTVTGTQYNSVAEIYDPASTTTGYFLDAEGALWNRMVANAKGRAQVDIGWTGGSFKYVYSGTDDSDADGRTNVEEGGPTRDTDQDGLPDYLDDNNDSDTLNDVDEIAQGLDPDSAADLRWEFGDQHGKGFKIRGGWSDWDANVDGQYFELVRGHSGTWIETDSGDYLTVDGNEIDSMTIRYKSDANGKIRFRWRNFASNTWRTIDGPSYTGGSGFVEHSFNVGADAQWAGKLIKAFRVDGINASGATTTFDWIRAESQDDPGGVDPTRVTLFSDGFESGDFTAGGWTLSVSPEIITTGQANGSYGTHINWGDVLTKSLNLEGMTEVTLSYAISCKPDMPADTSIALQVSADGGATWVTLEELRGTAGYVIREWNLAPEFLTSGFMFRFDKVGAASGDWARIDDVRITAAALEAGPTAPNVIVFLMDDFGLTDVQQHPTYFPDGSPLFETPNMLRLASEGMRFDHMYAQPLCSASRMSLLSGQNSAARYAAWAAITNGAVPAPSLPTSSGANRAYNIPSYLDHMPLEIETIAERMKEAGYATWHVGKWHLSPNDGGSNPNPASTYYPVEQGFDKQLSVGGYGPTPGYFGPFTMPEMNDHKGDPAPGTTGTFLPEHMAGLVQGLLDDHLANNPTQPFFLYYPTYSVHGPHDAKKSRFDYYADKLAGLSGSKHQHPVQAAQVEAVDGELGALLDYMDSNGLTDNTLLIFLSDNGGLVKAERGTLYDDIGPDGIPDAQGVSSDGTYATTTAPIAASTPLSDMAPRKGGKSSIYEGGMRVPMIVRYPGGQIPAAAVSHEPVHLIDIYQTILDYTPATPKAGYTLDGVSLKPVLQESGALPERDLFHYFPNAATTYNDEPAGAAVLDYPYKLIATYSTAHDAATVDYRLYRLDTDEGESDNIAGRFPLVVDAMRQKLDAFYADTGALVPTPNPAYNGTFFDSPEISIDGYLADAGLTPQSPETFRIADPDGDARNNRQEFLQQTAPNSSDQAVQNIWLNDGELRIALPANTDQSIYSILDANGAVVLTMAELELDGQYGPFFVYKPTVTIPSLDPADHSIAVSDAARPRMTADFTIDYRKLLSGSASSNSRTDTLQLNNGLLVDTGSGFAVVQDILVTTTGVDGEIKNGGANGLALTGGLRDVWFDSGEAVTLDFAVETTEGTTLTDLNVTIVEVGARSLDGEVVTLSNASVLATATWPSNTGVNGTPGALAGTFDFESGETLTVQTGPAGGENQRTQLSYITFRLSDPSMDKTDTDGDLLPDAYESSNGLNPNDPADGNTDNDSDGSSRGQEYLAGTSDFDADDRFSLGIDMQDPLSPKIRFDVKGQKAYRLHKSEDLGSWTLWEDFGVVTGDHAVALPLPPGKAREFYKLEAYLPN